MDSSDDGIDDLTVAMHLDSINYDSKNEEYEIQLSAVKLVHLDINNDIIRLKVPSHRLQRIKTPTYNAEIYTNNMSKSRDKTARKYTDNLPMKSPKTPHSDRSHKSDDNDNENDPNLDEILMVNNGNNDIDHKSDEPQFESDQEIINDDDEKRGHEITPKRPKNLHKNIDIKPLSKHIVIKEWNEISRKYKLNPSNDVNQTVNITKDGCFARIIFILKHYTRWILYKDKNFKSQDLPKDEDFLSITSFFEALEGYDKIKLLNDYYYLLENVLMSSDGDKSNDIEELILNNNNIFECDYCLNRLNNRNSELYNLSKLSESLRRDLYFINESNTLIVSGSVDERVEIGIQQYLDILYCSLLYPSNISDGGKYTMNIDSDKSDNEVITAPNHLYGEYFTYWKPDHLQYVRCKYNDLKTELLSNTIYNIAERDFFCLYNRAKDFLLSIMGRKIIAKRIKLQSKIKMDQKLSIGHVISLILYCNYYNSFISAYFIWKGCCKQSENTKFGEIRLKNNEIGNWCKLLNESIFCFGDMLSRDDRLYYNINKKLSFKYMSIEYNMAISTTSKFQIIRKFNNKYKGIILRMGKFEASKEYNYCFTMSFFSNYPLEYEYLIYGGKFEINDIIYNNKTHYNDIQSFKLYLEIIKGRWFSNNKLIFKKQYEKKLIYLITNFMNNSCSDNYIQILFDNLILSNGTIKKNKIIYINKECDKLLPELKKLIIQKLVPYLLQNNKSINKLSIFKKGYNTILMMKLNFNSINNSSFNKSLYSTEYKYSLLYLKNNRPQEIIFHFRCYKKHDDKNKKSLFKGCFEIKNLPKCVSKCKIIGGILLPQIQFEKWDQITLSHNKLYSGSSLFDITKIKNFDSVLIKIAFQIKEVTDIDDKIIPTIDL